MSFSGLGDLNWLGVIVAAIAYFALGAIWYAKPVFGKVWAEAGGIEMPEGERPPPSIFLMPLAGSILSAIVRVRDPDLDHHRGVRVEQAEADDVGRRERRLPRGGEPGRGDRHRRDGLSPYSM